MFDLKLLELLVEGEGHLDAYLKGERERIEILAETDPEAALGELDEFITEMEALKSYLEESAA